MHKPDDDIKDFFTGLRKADENRGIPEYEGMKPGKKEASVWYLIPAGIAASLLIILSIYFSIDFDLQAPGDETVVIIELGELESSTQFLIQDASSVYAWKPTSNSLINDFNE